MTCDCSDAPIKIFFTLWNDRDPDMPLLKRAKDSARPPTVTGECAVLSRCEKAGTCWRVADLTRVMSVNAG
jgi:hypothetical protein